VPEGHTIHRLARDHARWLRGTRVAVSSPQGRFAAGAELLDGEVLAGVDAHGKHLFHRYGSGGVVHVHLGLFGRFVDHPVPPPPPRATVRYRVVGRTRAIEVTGATACELLTPDEAQAIVARLGPDPIRRDGDPLASLAALRRRTVEIGRVLLDQRVIAGVGNVYRAEVLFVHGIHPLSPARTVSDEQWLSMWDTLRAWMRRGVREQVIITVDREEAGLVGARLTERTTYVYRREHCRRCGRPVRRWDLAGRWAYACESCQPAPRTARQIGAT
jgi:endonuclease VIII